MRILQVLDALDYGDGVSNDVINKNNLLSEMGYETQIYSKWVNPKVSKYRKDIDKMMLKKDDILLHHFSGKSHILKYILNANCNKVLVYHNITPEQFFNKNVHGQRCSEGEEQLKKIYDTYQFYLGDSSFNAECLRNIGISKEIDVLPIYIDFSILDMHLDKRIISTRLDSNKDKVFLFVGRIAPNKKHEDIIDIFEYYYNNIDCNSKLIFVGNHADYLDYYTSLQKKINDIGLSENIKFTGKVDEDQLYDNYLKADVFICMSEHEGFCIPLLESMYCGVPTIAYEAGAIKTTMGNAGVLVKYKSREMLAKLSYEIINNNMLKNRIIENQYKWIKTFSKEEIKKELRLLIEQWSGGKK